MAGFRHLADAVAVAQVVERRQRCRRLRKTQCAQFFALLGVQDCVVTTEPQAGERMIFAACIGEDAFEVACHRGAVGVEFAQHRRVVGGVHRGGDERLILVEGG